MSRCLWSTHLRRGDCTLDLHHYVKRRVQGIKHRDLEVLKATGGSWLHKGSEGLDGMELAAKQKKAVPTDGFLETQASMLPTGVTPSASTGAKSNRVPEDRFPGEAL